MSHKKIGTFHVKNQVIFRIFKCFCGGLLKVVSEKFKEQYTWLYKCPFL